MIRECSRTQLLGINAWKEKALIETQFCPEFLKAESWTVVPVESGLHFANADIQRIGSFLESGKSDVFYSLLLESIDAPACLVFEASVAGVSRFNLECGHFSYLVLAADQSFAIVCSVDDYYLVASGSGEKLQGLLGTDPCSAKEEFRRLAKNNPDQPELEVVSERYT